MNTKLISPPLVQMSLMPSTWMSTLVGSAREEWWNSMIVTQQPQRNSASALHNSHRNVVIQAWQVLLWKSFLIKLKHSQILMLKILFPSSSCDHFFQKSTFFQISSRVTLSMSTTQPYFPLVHKYISVIKPLSMVYRFGKVLHFPCQLQVRDKSHSADSILL